MHSKFVEDSRLQKASSMAVDDRDSIRVCYGHLVGLNPHQSAVFLVQFMDSQISSAPATLIHIPEIGELGQEWTWYVLDRPVSNERQNPEEER